ncbi:MAG: FHA domain-containing protein [Erysipelotrichaceae bacterium]|nr:FHA domain-containing protein [Erysipelotrichaceae bacterium]
MGKYKICPNCHNKNEPGMIECIYCETDLTGVKITDDETEKMMQDDKEESSNSKIKLVRVCDCGAINPSNARKCFSCHEDISDITPTPEIQEEKKETEYILSSLDDQYVYKMTNGEVIIGRENVMSEYLSAKSYVSRIHAKLIIEDGHLFIENLSSTNFTYVNNEKISEKTKLKENDEIGLGGIKRNGNYQGEAAYFLVRINQCM